MPTSAIATVVSIQIITVMAINKLQINYVSILYDVSMPQLLILGVTENTLIQYTT